MEDERRLMYDVITRATKILTLMAPAGPSGCCVLRSTHSISDFEGHQWGRGDVVYWDPRGESRFSWRLASPNC
eukprot:CAMPEP_0204182986 /NCGR_PEP_ID=MMETSP0361-20130328/53228_1 /ASSEMBLY_ACC=CAM_ASM_000343 /TAXON_ID=268821 /ORGANISM="Scrippsiella Hangoei, Strain SHTV-5" /LENGTH=72 /DNA_ID=CAMNT_0051142811 /DNA_START=273 /DNA_END=488 /DNA_ORIENTATION=-